MGDKNVSRSLYVREVPEDVHGVLRVRAAASGMSVSGYVLGLLREETSTPTAAEVFARRREPVTVTNEEILAAIHEGRR